MVKKHAVTVVVDNRRGEDTAQSDAETVVRQELDTCRIRNVSVSHSKTSARPTFNNGNTYWTIDVIVVGSMTDSQLQSLENSREEIEIIEEVS